MTEVRKRQKICDCGRSQFHRRQKRKKEQCKRKRQTLVYNPEEEAWHEPYMRDLRKEFSDVSILCDSMIELPWKDIALPTAGMKIRKEVSTNLLDDLDDGDIEGAAAETKEKESTGTMPLPWHDLLITETVQSKQADPESCGSSLEIPWSDLALDRPMEIRPILEEEPCDVDDVEIPWNDILMPQNIVIESQKKTKHPSSKYPARTVTGPACIGCKLCCSKVGGRTRAAASCN